MWNIGQWVTLLTDNSTYSIKGLETAQGKYLAIHMQAMSFTSGANIGTLPSNWQPKVIARFLFVSGTSYGFCNMEANGNIRLYATEGNQASTDYILKISQDL